VCVCVCVCALVCVLHLKKDCPPFDPTLLMLHLKTDGPFASLLHATPQNGLSICFIDANGLSVSFMAACYISKRTVRVHF
jgi:hypothetical protein